MQNALCYLKRESNSSHKKIIALITTTRAEWGLLSPLAKSLDHSHFFMLRVVASGTHLKKEYGNTYREILDDGIEIHKKINILENSDTKFDIAKNISNAILKFSKYFLAYRPDIVVVLGDRYEILGVSIAAANLNIPIAHICGGESTEGASDEWIRHSITKMAFLHFTTTAAYRARVIQLGEDPSRVYNVGSLAVENVLNTKFYDKQNLAKFLGVGISFLDKFCVLTYHSVTLEERDLTSDVEIIIESILKKGLNILATKSNADSNSVMINKAIEYYATKFEKRIVLKDSLGRVGYLSAVKHSQFVIGNSSSGVSEVGMLGIIAIDIGNRQRGRIANDGVIRIDMEQQQIEMAIERALKEKKCNISSIYGNGETSKKIEIALTQVVEKTIDLKKKFYDVKI